MSCTICTRQRVDGCCCRLVQRGNEGGGFWRRRRCRDALAKMVGPTGHVTGIDANRAQLEQASELCGREGLSNTSFVEASAYETGLPRNYFDLVYCRFLLLHLEDPKSCLREMRNVLRPGGVLVVEDGDLSTAGSIPPSAMDAFAYLFGQLGRARGLNYSVASDLYQLILGAGFSEVNLEIHQPAILRGENRYFLKWSVEEAGPALVHEGIISADALAGTLAAMEEVAEDPNFLILAPRMSLVWAHKAEG
jgi:SAM-dependent methyltransferase